MRTSTALLLICIVPEKSYYNEKLQMSYYIAIWMDFLDDRSFVFQSLS